MYVGQGSGNVPIYTSMPADIAPDVQAAVIEGQVEAGKSGSLVAAGTARYSVAFNYTEVGGPSGKLNDWWTQQISLLLGMALVLQPKL